MTSLTAALLEQHRDTEPGRAAPPATTPLRVAPDVVLLGPTVASFVVPLADARLGGAASRVRAIAWPERSIGARAIDGEAKTLVESAARLGVPLLAAVGDACEPMFRETAAAPGRLAAVCGLDDEALGALGTLAVRVTALQAVDALSGGLLRTPARPLVRWQCEGDLSPGVRGADVGLELARRWRAARPGVGTARSVTAVECGGPGIEALPFGDRVALAHALVTAGVAHVLMPSDGRTREAMRAWGRDSDWREIRFETGDEPGVVLEQLDLASLEPLVAPWSDPSFARPLRQSLGRPLRGVLVGPFADESEFVTLATLLDGGRQAMADGLQVVALPGTDALRESLEAAGVLARLRAAGAVVPEPGTAWAAPAAESEGTWLGTGAGAAVRARFGDRLWAANIEVCGASACAGVVADPRASGVPALASDRLPGAPRVLPPPASVDTAAARSDAPRAIVTAPLQGALRGIVWMEVGDDVTAEDVLPRGARARKRALDAEPGALFAARLGTWDGAGAAGDGVMTAGRMFGGGPRSDEAAWALRRAGVRAVLARSFAPDAVRALVYAGVLPLTSTRHALGRLARLGEEIEVPSLPEAVEPGHSVGVRNLTRGVQDALTHGLDGELVDIWRRGGLLAEGGDDVR